MGSIQGSTMIFGVPGNRGTFLFPRRAHLLTTCKAGGGILPSGQARALFTNCLSAISPEGAGNAASGIACAVGSMFCFIIKTVVSVLETTRRLPA